MQVKELFFLLWTAYRILLPWRISIDPSLFQKGIQKLCKNLHLLPLSTANEIHQFVNFVILFNHFNLYLLLLFICFIYPLILHFDYFYLFCLPFIFICLSLYLKLCLFLFSLTNNFYELLLFYQKFWRIFKCCKNSF